MPMNSRVNTLRNALLLVVMCCSAAHARDNAITLYGGYRDGGSFTDANTDNVLSLDGSGSGAIAVDLALDASRQWQWYLSQQNTTMAITQAAAPAPASLPLKLTYLHFGGTYFFQGPVGGGPYVVGGLGATVMRPGLSGYTDELRASMNLGLGYQLPLGEQVALRFEARGYFTAVNSNGGLFCSGGCVLHIKADAVTQGELQLGLSFRY